MAAQTPTPSGGTLPGLEGLVHDAALSLMALRDPRAVVARATQLIASLCRSGHWRAAYLSVDDGIVTELAVADPAGTKPGNRLLRHDPYTGAVVQDLQPLLVEVDPASIGPTMRDLIEETGVTHAALIPVAPKGELHGILSVGSRGAAIGDDLFVRCRALGNVVESALGLALAQHELEVKANSDDLTGLANEKGLALFFEAECQTRAVCILAIDVDGLGLIRAVYGPAVTDDVLAQVARASSGVLRRGDIMARVKPGQFVAVVAHADQSDARLVAARIHEAVAKVSAEGIDVSVTIGSACCGIDGDPHRTRRLAEQALCEIERAGRRRPARCPHFPETRWTPRI
jgi:diguanylate cyclase (GGDEF)-like protein